MYDVILMDLQMPVMDGFETTVSIRNSLEKPKSEIPIIALTANAIKGDREKCIELGMNDYISKPFEPDQLFNKLKPFYHTETMSETNRYDAEIVVENKQKDDKGKLTNLGYLTSMSNNNKSFIHEMISTFISSTPASLDNMEKALEGGDLEKVGQIAHKIKPSLTFMGIDSLKDAVKEIELVGKEGRDREKLKIAVPEFISRLTMAIQELEERVAEFQ